MRVKRAAFSSREFPLDLAGNEICKLHARTLLFCFVCFVLFFLRGTPIIRTGEWRQKAEVIFRCRTFVGKGYTGTHCAQFHRCSLLSNNTE